MITGKQVKAARELLGWSQADLTIQADVGRTTIHRLENGEATGDHLVRLIEGAFRAAGVEFPEGELPRLKSGAIKRATWRPPPGALRRRGIRLTSARQRSPLGLNGIPFLS